MTVILLVSCGAMGSALGRLLVLGGHKVLFPAAGRSRATLERAQLAGIEALDLTHEELWKQHGTQIELVLSVLPPALAKEFADDFALYSREINAPGPHGRTFLDLNAISPAEATEIEFALSRDNSCTYVNGSIIGMPPTFRDAVSPTLDTLTHNPCIYLSSTPRSRPCLLQAQTLLRASGWKVRYMSPDEADDPTVASTAAKSLKLCYSSIAKGVMALATTAALASTSTSQTVSQALATELSESLPGFATFISKQMQNVVPKSTRFVAEMRQIGAFTQSSTDTPEMSAVWESIALLFNHISQQNGTTRGTEIDQQLRRFGVLVQDSLQHTTVHQDQEKVHDSA